MSKPFDAISKQLLELSPADWPPLIREPRTAVDVIDADVSTFSGAADKVLRVHGKADEWLMHVEFQSGPDSSVPRRMHVYNGLLEHRHELPVRSAVVLLRPAAYLSNMTGVYRRGLKGEKPYLTFRYEIIRVWRLPVERLLKGGLGMLPLAPLSNVTEASLPHVLEQMQQRVRREPPSMRKDLWTATYVLMGLRYEATQIRSLLQEVLGMEESVTYQEIIRKGEARGELREARKILLLQGRKQFGQPDAEVATAVEAIGDLQRLEDLAERLLQAKSWQELLGLPEPPPGTRRRKSTT